MDKVEKEKNRRLLKTYGITLKDFNRLLEDQKGVCGICKKLYPRMCLDHIHVKGFKKMEQKDKIKYVRGILCFLCNTGLKGFDKTVSGTENRNRLEGTYKYFKKYKLKGEI